MPTLTVACPSCGADTVRYWNGQPAWCQACHADDFVRRTIGHLEALTPEQRTLILARLRAAFPDEP